MCVASVTLTDSHSQRLFSVPNSDPHIPLIKPKGKGWQELGPWTRACNDATGWTQTSDPHVEYHRHLRAYRKRFSAVITAVRSVELIPDTKWDLSKFVRSNKGCFDSFDACHEGFFVDDVTEVPELSQVPAHLWAQHKHDVGLIKNAEPVIITPKSSYRPCQNQYPLKKEAVEGIKPVFEALRKAGVIVPCENSPVRTPIFPVKKIKQVGQPDEWRSDLQEVPLQNAGLELFVDGSASRDPGTGKNQTGFAVTTLHVIVLAEPLPSNYSAQAAELVALTKACTLAKDKSVNIFTDSHYAWGVCHSFGQIWANRKFLTASGKPIAHHTLVASLLDALLLPKQIAVCKCEAHTNKPDLISQGNARADAAAKTAAKQ
ncbi:uncharacterized protein LOC119034487 isoform X3 [Acanthopagrus latus]|uniref:uncharacterized protein LOC119034487 isoform X3 n=1 Tax=Acanthopagrus latus TaxID=8177 RepID=UPI00187CC354|nr:uncharacterized protein LOC119034487 isoform X3 [Acanthopagrus latus]